MDRLADLARNVGFGTRIQRRGQFDPLTPGHRSGRADRSSSSGTQSGLARLGKPIRSLAGYRSQSSLAALPGLSETS